MPNAPQLTTGTPPIHFHRPCRIIKASLLINILAQVNDASNVRFTLQLTPNHPPKMRRPTTVLVSGLTQILI